MSKFQKNEHTPGWQKKCDWEKIEEWKKENLPGEQDLPDERFPRSDQWQHTTPPPPNGSKFSQFHVVFLEIFDKVIGCCPLLEVGAPSYGES